MSTHEENYLMNMNFESASHMKYNKLKSSFKSIDKIIDASDVTEINDSMFDSFDYSIDKQPEPDPIPTISNMNFGIIVMVVKLFKLVVIDHFILVPKSKRINCL